MTDACQKPDPTGYTVAPARRAADEKIPATARGRLLLERIAVEGPHNLDPGKHRRAAFDVEPELAA